MQTFIKYFLICLLLLASSCSLGPRRPPITPGTIPTPRPVSIEDEQYGHQVLNKLSEEFELDYSDPRLDDIERIVDRITVAAGVATEPWHVYLFKEPDVKNAAATRGNHVFVWSGMLDFAQSNEELSTIIGHEIAHVLAGHTDPDPNEQVRKMLISIAASAASIAVSKQAGGNAGNLTGSLTQQLGAGVLVNPYSREREAEADHIGFFLMADAGYNPEAAIRFWERAEKSPDFSHSMEFFSTHPLAHDRLINLQALLPEAMDRYYKATGKKPSKKPVKQVKPATVHKLGAHPSRDSFALNKQSLPGETWRVVSRVAKLYSQPNQRSKPIGEFKKGARVLVIRRKGSWLEIEKPDRGYLRARDLKLVYNSR